MKYLLILKFFLTTKKGQFRYSFLFPIICLFIGSYIIFLTFSIMNGMETTILDDIKGFNYKYFTQASNIKKYKYENEGIEKLVLIKNDDKESYLILKSYKEFDHYKNKISRYITSDLKINGLIISSYISDELNLSIGDSTYIFFPTNINLTTKNIPSKQVAISSIYEMETTLYDSKYIICSTHLIKDIVKLSDKVTHFADNKINDDVLLNSDNDILLSALSLEKKIYTSLGYLVIAISCIMMFNIMVMVIIDKGKQLLFVNKIGLSDRNIYRIIIIKNLIISLSLSILALFLAEFTIYLNYEYNIFAIIFENLPFKIVPMNNNAYNYILLLCLINILSMVSSILPYAMKNKIMRYYA